MSNHTDAILSPSGAPLPGRKAKSATSVPSKRRGRPQRFSDLPEAVKVQALHDHLTLVHEMSEADWTIDYYGLPFAEAQRQHLAITPHKADHTGEAP